MAWSEGELQDFGWLYRCEIGMIVECEHRRCMRRKAGETCRNEVRHAAHRGVANSYEL